MNKTLIAVVAVTLPILVVSWLVGSKFVDFAFKRGEDRANFEPPVAGVHILDKDAVSLPMPDFTHESWTVAASEDENRRATAFYAEEETHDWIIMVHGYCRHQGYVYDYADAYLRRGFNVLTPDLNASGTSDGEYLTMGVYESDDIVRWVGEIVKRDENARIALHGVSMGAATVMLATAKELPSNVKACIEDCGYTSAYTMLSDQIEKIYGISSFPVIDLANIANRIKVGCFITDASPIEAVKSTKVPTLFIHGDADNLVPFDMMNELYAASAAPVKEQMVVGGAGHASASTVYGDRYFDGAVAFLRMAGME